MEDPPKRPSPGRYSLSTDGSSEMAAVRIDSTQMVAVTPDAPPHSPDGPSNGAVPKRATMPHGMQAVQPKEARAAGVAAAAASPNPKGSQTVRRATMRETPAVAPPQPAAAPKKKPSVRPPSLRPPPPSTKRGDSMPPAPLSLDFDEGSIAHAFDALMSDGPTEVGRANVDLAPVRELFASLAANHMRHVRDFMIDVKWGEAPRDWLEICVPAVTSLKRAADRLEIPELGTALESFGSAIKDELASDDASKTIAGATKERLLGSYEQLVTILPQAFALDRDRSQREAVIIQSLCLSVPDVRKVTIDKLHAAGLTSLATLFEAKPDEVSQVAGIPLALAQRIVERFQAYRQELANASPQDARAAERERLATLTEKLTEQHRGYEEAADAWGPEAKAKKRDLFRAREETWLEISLLLARFGEVERLQGIEKVPYAARITQLTDWLEEARQKYRAEPD